MGLRTHLGEVTGNSWLSKWAACFQPMEEITSSIIVDLFFLERLLTHKHIHSHENLPHLFFFLFLFLI